MSDRPVCTVRVFFPARPEHFAYLMPAPDKPFYAGGPGRVVVLDGVPTYSRREQHRWFFDAGGTMIHADGTPYTDEELDARHPDPAAINERLRAFSLRRLAFI